VAIHWTQGTGMYVGDGSVYVVVGEDKQAFSAYWLGSGVGRGATQRELKLVDDKFVVAALQSEDGELTELVLEDNMAGFWESSGAQIFRTELPPRPAPPPGVAASKAVRLMGPGAAMMVGAPSRTSEILVGTATVPGNRSEILPADEEAEQQDALPPAAKEIVDRACRAYKVMSGTNGILILAQNGRYFTPDDLPDLFGEYLEQPYRFRLLSALRNDSRTRRLTKLEVHPFDSLGRATPERSARRQEGWYVQTDAGEERVCGLDDAYILRASRMAARAVVLRGGVVQGKTLVGIDGVISTGAKVFSLVEGHEFDLLFARTGAHWDVGLLVSVRDSGSAEAPVEKMVLAYRLKVVAGEIVVVDALEAVRRLSFFAVPGRDGKLRFFRKF
jgi:hypothetical protein